MVWIELASCLGVSGLGPGFDCQRSPLGTMARRFGLYHCTSSHPMPMLIPLNQKPDAQAQKLKLSAKHCSACSVMKPFLRLAAGDRGRAWLQLVTLALVSPRMSVRHVSLTLTVGPLASETNSWPFMLQSTSGPEPRQHSGMACNFCSSSGLRRPAEAK